MLSPDYFAFQLTTSRRDRHFLRFIIFASWSISTHDLTKRSTFLNANGRNLIAYFNSRPHEEVDYANLCCLHVRSYFNSRPHEEVDPELHRQLLQAVQFQLTTSRRGRQQKYTNHPMLLLIHLAYSTKTHHSITHNRVYSTLSFNRSEERRVGKECRL